MMPIKVWLLVLFVSGGGSHGAPVVIDNIATAEDCARIQRSMLGIDGLWTTGRCIQVAKIPVK
jgi:hypothetical protein